ncbi:hypothetical protein DFG55_01965 [Xanthomonas campestris pv. campestris]|nr:hypothetical protein AAW18_15200 [Xanthomonas campestris pv. campestris]QCX65406.1 hypothetical protein DFG55_01965 [Xanthomonas campestris pv. campestris]
MTWCRVSGARAGDVARIRFAMHELARAGRDCRPGLVRMQLAAGHTVAQGEHGSEVDGDIRLA